MAVACQGYTVVAANTRHVYLLRYAIFFQRVRENENTSTTSPHSTTQICISTTLYNAETLSDDIVNCFLLRSEFVSFTSITELPLNICAKTSYNHSLTVVVCKITYLLVGQKSSRLLVLIRICRNYKILKCKQVDCVPGTEWIRGQI